LFFHINDFEFSYVPVRIRSFLNTMITTNTSKDDCLFGNNIASYISRLLDNKHRILQDAFFARHSFILRERNHPKCLFFLAIPQFIIHFVKQKVRSAFTSTGKLAHVVAYDHDKNNKCKLLSVKIKFFINYKNLVRILEKTNK
jgi:hypothetical protein